MKIKPVIKRLRIGSDAESGAPLVVSDCGKTWKVPPREAPKWFMMRVCEQLVDDGYAVIINNENNGACDDP